MLLEETFCTVEIGVVAQFDDNFRKIPGCKRPSGYLDGSQHDTKNGRSKYAMMHHHETRPKERKKDLCVKMVEWCGSQKKRNA